MEIILKAASAGTMESSDAYVEVEPGNSGLDIHVESVVAQQFGQAIEAAVKKVLEEGYRTIDIMPQEESKRAAVTQIGTAKMGDLIAERI